MSEYIPFELQAEIIRLTVPVKPLLRFRSVCKQWKSLIDSHEFIAQHSVNKAHPHHLLLRYDVVSGHEFKSIIDDDDFPQNKLSPIVTPDLKLVSMSFMFDSSHGVVCLYGFDVYLKYHLVLWNPSIGKTVVVGLPHNNPTALGFGVCPKTVEPKIVSMNRSDELDSWTVEIYSLSSGAWRSIPMNGHLSGATEFDSYQVVIDGVVYWSVFDSSNDRGGYIVSFDFTTEEVREVAVPHSLAHIKIDIFKFNDSVGVLDVDTFENTCDVWALMDNGLVKQFSLVGFTPYDGQHRSDIIGFGKNGQPIREIPSESEDGSAGTRLEAYEPYTQHRTDLGIFIPYGLDPFEPNIMMTSYTESLLLLHHSDSCNQGTSSSMPAAAAADSNDF